MLHHIRKAPTGALTPCRHAGCGPVLAPAVKAKRRGVAPARASASPAQVAQPEEEAPRPSPRQLAGRVVGTCSLLYLKREGVLSLVRNANSVTGALDLMAWVAIIAFIWVALCYAAGEFEGFSMACEKVEKRIANIEAAVHRLEARTAWLSWLERPAAKSQA